MRMPTLVAALLLGACAAPERATETAGPEPPANVKSTERVTPEVRYYVVADA